MPNWVQNRLTIYGQETKIEKCLLFCKSEDSDFDFNKIVPMPETLDITVSRDSVQAAAYVYSLLSEKKQKEISGVLKTTTTMEAGCFPRVEKTWFEAINDCLKDIDVWNQKINSWKPGASDIECGAETFEEYGRIVLNNILNYGHTGWYTWRCDHWGTKWTADNVVVDRSGQTGHGQEPQATVYCQTAWDCPALIVYALSEKYPELTFMLAYADEDIGSNCGFFSLKRGVALHGDVRYDYSDWKDNPELKREAITFACDVWGYDPEEYLEDENNEEE